MFIFRRQIWRRRFDESFQTARRYLLLCIKSSVTHMDTITIICSMASIRHYKWNCFEFWDKIKRRKLYSRRIMNEIRLKAYHLRLYFYTIYAYARCSIMKGFGDPLTNGTIYTYWIMNILCSYQSDNCIWIRRIRLHSGQSIFHINVYLMSSFRLVIDI